MNPVDQGPAPGEPVPIEANVQAGPVPNVEPEPPVAQVPNIEPEPVQPVAPLVADGPSPAPVVEDISNDELDWAAPEEPDVSRDSVRILNLPVLIVVGFIFLISILVILVYFYFSGFKIRPIDDPPVGSYERRFSPGHFARSRENDGLYILSRPDVTSEEAGTASTSDDGLLMNHFSTCFNTISLAGADRPTVTTMVAGPSTQAPSELPVAPFASVSGPDEEVSSPATEEVGDEESGQARPPKRSRLDRSRVILSIESQILCFF